MNNENLTTEPREVNLEANSIDEAPVVGGGCYVAFGSNLCQDQMAKRLKDFRFIERVRIKGWRLGFGSYNSVATITESEGDRAAAVIYWMSEEDFRRMDGFEGLRSTKNYRRLRVEVTGYEGQPVYTYLLRSGETEGCRPNKSYWSRILKAMKRQGFGPEAADLTELGYE